MFIERKISSHLIFETENILRALEKIARNKRRLVYVVAEDGCLMGSLSDGDFRRWIVAQKNIDLNTEVQQVMNRDVVSRNTRTARRDIESAFAPAINSIPLTDEHNRLVAIAFQSDGAIAIGKHVISEVGACFIIAEIGNNHNGDINLAKRLVDLAFEAGADCVKFQMRDLRSLYKSGGSQDNTADLGAQYTLDLLSKFQLGDSELFEVFDHCRSHGMMPLCTPWDAVSLRKLEAYGMEAYKVASADLTNHHLLDELASTGKPLICSTGMSSEAEIKSSVDFLRGRGVEFILLHCNSTYPTPFKDVNLAYLPRLRELAGSVVGYSGHERGTAIPVAAVAMGARIVEKHFTIDKTMEGNDHKVSLLPEEFRRMVKEIREVEESMGKSSERLITQGEMINRETLAKSLVAARTIRAGEVIRPDMLDVKSPGQGLQPMYLRELVGKQSKRDMQAGGLFYPSDLRAEGYKPRKYKFQRPFGIPVRYHDFAALAPLSNLDFVEFHLSYQDLEQQISKFFDKPQGIGFAVHSPELFSNDHILDLCAEDPAYRAKSIRELNKVCDVTRELKSYFPATERPVIVVNAGGFSTEGFAPVAQRRKMYEMVASSLGEVDANGVEIIIQTMPPFPWHFGGQSFHNLFVDPDEISAFCDEHGTRICYDVSHSMMTCNYYKTSLHDFTNKVGKYIAHLHVVDAKDADGEGVQIGQGDVDFEELAIDLARTAPHAQFIPEVWQGHKNNGEGFWEALEFLEGKL